MQWLILGIGLGVLLTLPLVYLFSRRTERRVRQLARRARTAERLAELGTLTGGLAHEIKNPLSTVGLNVQLMQEDVADLSRDLPEDVETRDKLSRLDRRLGSLIRETQRLRDILEDFLKFAGRIKLNRQPSDVPKLLDELIDFFDPQAQAAGVQLRAQVDDLPPISADGDLLKQALLNLLINAAQAMQHAREKNQPHGGAGELIIRTEKKHTHLLIHITDTGPGIDEDTLKQIFQPYYSNKPTGTGLGLAVSRRIIEEHGGHIHVHTEVGRGSDFVIELPVGEMGRAEGNRE